MGKYLFDFKNVLCQRCTTYYRDTNSHMENYLFRKYGDYFILVKANGGFMETSDVEDLL